MQCCCTDTKRPAWMLSLQRRRLAVPTTLPRHLILTVHIQVLAAAYDIPSVARQAANATSRIQEEVSVQ